MPRNKWRHNSISSEYYAWRNMKARCLNPNHAAYYNYGERGITVCVEWIESFDAFFEDMGPKPSPIHSLERKDNNGNYTPDNCIWATDKEQHNNERRNRVIEYRGIIMTATQWARYLKISPNTFLKRLERMPPEQAIDMNWHDIQGYAKLVEDRLRKEINNA